MYVEYWFRMIPDLVLLEVGLCVASPVWVGLLGVYPSVPLLFSIQGDLSVSRMIGVRPAYIFSHAASTHSSICFGSLFHKNIKSSSTTSIRASIEALNSDVDTAWRARLSANLDVAFHMHFRRTFLQIIPLNSIRHARFQRIHFLQAQPYRLLL